MVNSGADVNAQREKDGLTALHLAAMEGKPQCLKALIELGADVNILDSSGHTALDFTRYAGKESEDILLAAGANRNRLWGSTNIFNDATGAQNIIPFPIIFTGAAILFRLVQKRYSPTILAFGCLGLTHFMFIIFPQIQYSGMNSLSYIKTVTWFYSIVPVALLTIYFFKAESSPTVKKFVAYSVSAYMAAAAISVLGLIALVIAISGTS